MFILDWLQLFQSSIEQLIIWDGKQNSIHSQCWQWFGHTITYTNLHVNSCDPAKDMPVPHSDEDSPMDTFNYHSQFGLHDQSDSAFEPSVFCRPFFHNTSDALCTLAVPASLPQLPAVCDFFNWQPNQDTFDELHWYAHYMQQVLMDLVTLWPRTNSPVPTLLASVPSSNYIGLVLHAQV
uniref:Uncharacterized protein n=1 Tax=Moniliophthora roreri TaxID=221103 RepID=A0A0W0G4Y3_MONRR